MGRHVAKHTHRFVKISGKYTPIWKCGDGACNFFIYFSQEHTLFGRDSICWICGNTFKMTEEAMQEDNPRCDSCRRGVSDSESEAENFLNSLSKAEASKE